MKTLHNMRVLLYAIKIALSLFVTAALILWAWNNSLMIILGLPTIHIKESIGLIILALGISFIFGSRGFNFTRLSGE